MFLSFSLSKNNNCYWDPPLLLNMWRFDRTLTYMRGSHAPTFLLLEFCSLLHVSYTVHFTDFNLELFLFLFVRYVIYGSV